MSTTKLSIEVLESIQAKYEEAFVKTARMVRKSLVETLATDKDAKKFIFEQFNSLKSLLSSELALIANTYRDPTQVPISSKTKQKDAKDTLVEEAQSASSSEKPSTSSKKPSTSSEKSSSSTKKSTPSTSLPKVNDLKGMDRAALEEAVKAHSLPFVEKTPLVKLRSTLKKAIEESKLNKFVKESEEQINTLKKTGEFVLTETQKKDFAKTQNQSSKTTKKTTTNVTSNTVKKTNTPPEKTTSTKTKKGKKAKKEGPPRAKNAYIYFTLEKRPEVMNENPKLTFSEASKIVGDAWKALPSANRAKFEALASDDKARYASEVAASA